MSVPQAVRDWALVGRLSREVMIKSWNNHNKAYLTVCQKLDMRPMYERSDLRNWKDRKYQLSQAIGSDA